MRKRVQSKAELEKKKAQEEKINELRRKRISDKIKKDKEMEQRKSWSNHEAAYELKVSDPVKIRFKGMEFTGYVTEIKKDKKKNTVSYTVNSVNGEIKNLNKSHLSKRKVHKSGISIKEVPENLKKKSTRDLLNILNGLRQNARYEWSEEQVKCVLATREHIPSKKERKEFHSPKKKKR